MRLCPSAGETRTCAQAGSLRGSRAISHTGHGFFQNFSTIFIRRSKRGSWGRRGSAVERGPVQFVAQLLRTLPRSAMKQGISRVYDESEQEPLECRLAREM